MTSVISRRLDLRTNLRHIRRLTGRRLIAGDPQLDATGAITDGAGVLQTDVADMQAEAARSINTDDLTPYAENRDPWKVRIPRLGRNGWERLKRKWAQRRAFLAQVMSSEFPLSTRIDILKAGRQFTPPELQEIREELDARRLDEFHRLQAQLACRRIIERLTTLGKCSSVQSEGRRVIRGQVQINYIEYNTLYYRLYVDGAHMPYGVSIMDIQGDEVCTDLSVAVNHPVRSEIKKIGNDVIGLYYTVEIAATLDVPNLCKFSELLPLMPASAASLAFITGYSAGKRLRWTNLEEMPHFLGGGQTNGGKSNMMHVLACSLISRNTPDQVRLLMVDLKNGIEMMRYKGTPHLIAKYDGADARDYIEQVPTGIAIMPDQAVHIMRWLVRESDRRIQMFAKAEAQNLRQWNRGHPNRRLPYIVIIFDELAQLRLDPDSKDAGYKLMQKILSTSRAAGISFVTFTQSSKNTIIDEFIKVNLPGRICFSMPDSSSSILFVGTGAAINLMPAGRAIFKYGTEQYLVQTPLIEPKDITEIVENAKQGKLTGHLSARTVLPEEIIEWALEHNDSSIAQRDVFRHFGGELRRIEYEPLLRLLKEMEDKDYRVGDRLYKVLPGIGNRPRALIRLDVEIHGEPAELATPITSQITADRPERCAYCGVKLAEDASAEFCPECGAPL